MGLSARLRWRVQNHPGLEKAGRDEPPLSVGPGENHTPLGKGGYVRNGSFAVADGENHEILPSGDKRTSDSYDSPWSTEATRAAVVQISKPASSVGLTVLGH